MVMCQEISQYRPKQIDETDTTPDHTNHGIGAECAIERARSALGAEILNGTVCPIDGPTKNSNSSGARPLEQGDTLAHVEPRPFNV